VTYEIRALGVADVDEYRRIRLESLRLHPEAFGADHDESAALDRAQFAERLATPGLTRFGGFDGVHLVGLAGLQIRSSAKERHKADLFSMYVDRAHRRTGLAEQLVSAVIAGAREAGAAVLHLSVTVGNTPAQRLYRRVGFAVYGIEQRSLLVNGVFLDEELMELNLDSDPAPVRSPAIMDGSAASSPAR
jgi:ribosomal protein S18 acetylase RimI-like enzyme